jgi:hypothetical protein
MHKDSMEGEALREAERGDVLERQDSVEEERKSEDIAEGGGRSIT